MNNMAERNNYAIYEAYKNEVFESWRISGELKKMIKSDIKVAALYLLHKPGKN